MNTTIDLLKDAVDRITVDDDAIFALIVEQCQKCCLYGGGGNDTTGTDG
jgi:hypothetical protein